MSPRAQGRRDGEGRRDLRIDFLEGGRYVGIPQNAVNKGYDALPSRSAKFNSERDTPIYDLLLGNRNLELMRTLDKGRATT